LVTAAVDPDSIDLPWWREPDRHDQDGRPWPWWIPDEAPGGLGHAELWIDEAALDLYARGDAAPAVTVRHHVEGAATWTGALIRFNRYPGMKEPAVYRIVTRSHSSANRWRPYYVAVWPD
jgi:hypothetical protein